MLLHAQGGSAGMEMEMGMGIGMIMIRVCPVVLIFLAPEMTLTAM